MMLKRIWSQTYKNFYVAYRNFFRLFDVTVWPLMLLFSITLFVNYIRGNSNVISMVILGVIGWRVVYHMQIDLTTSWMEEYWSHSLNHFIISPLSMLEFVIGNIITGIFKFIFVLIMMLVVVFFAFGFTLTNIPVFLIGIISLGLFGLAIGLMTLGIVLIYHENAYTAAYIFPDLLVLLSGVYYPIAIFPQWLQTAVKFMPAVYGFDVLKSTVGLAEPNYIMLFATLAVWLLIGTLFLGFCYRHAKKIGRLGRMS